MYTHRLCSLVCITSYFPAISLPFFSPLLKYCGRKVKKDRKNDSLVTACHSQCALLLWPPKLVEKLMLLLAGNYLRPFISLREIGL